MKKELMKNKLVKEEVKRNGYWVQFKKRCPECDCTNYMRPNVDVMLCKVCGTKIYKDEKTKFKYELGRRLKR
jgi:ribosomal protein L37AE/L43A